MIPKTRKAWCLTYKGEIWPHYCATNRQFVKHDAVDQLGKSWHELEQDGFRVRRVEIKVLV